MGQLMLWLWTGVALLQVWVVGSAIRRRGKGLDTSSPAALLCATLGSAVPVVALVMFVTAFVVMRGSNVAQMNDPNRMTGWDLWYHVWPFLYYSLGPVGLLTLAVLVAPPFRRDVWRVHLARVLCVALAAFLAWAVVTFFPTA